MWKDVEERAKVLEEKEKKVLEAEKGIDKAKTEDEATAAAKVLQEAYKEDYNERKKTGILDKLLDLLTSIF